MKPRFAQSATSFSMSLMSAMGGRVSKAPGAVSTAGTGLGYRPRRAGRVAGARGGGSLLSGAGAALRPVAGARPAQHVGHLPGGPGGASLGPRGAPPAVLRALGRDAEA